MVCLRNPRTCRGGHTRPGARLVLGAAVAMLALAGLVLGGCGRVLPGGGPQNPTNRSGVTTSIAELQKVEVKQYKGKDLSSIGDFRENSIKGPQYVDPKAYRLKITGQVTQPQTLTYDQVKALPRVEKLVRLNCVEGWSVDIVWQGVLLKDLLAKAGYDQNAKVVIFRAADGYSSSLPLDYIVGRNIVFADTINGVALPPERGFPFQVVAEDRFGYKWVKWVTEIEVSNDTSFRGYWEKRGYSNDASLSN
jgi:DMSO/TMAO reductase YedYZ molybdopterin-dependent catalytic subunit